MHKRFRNFNIAPSQKTQKRHLKNQRIQSNQSRENKPKQFQSTYANMADKFSQLPYIFKRRALDRNNH